MSTDERMEKMERQLARMRWLNRCLIAYIVLSLGVWFIERTFTAETAWMGSGIKEIRANVFILEDENGEPRAMLCMDKNGPGLDLCDENGTIRAILSMRGLSLYDENDKPRAGLDGSGLSLWDKNGDVILSLDKDGPRLVLRDENGKSGAVLAMLKDGPGLSLEGGNGKPCAMLSVDKDMLMLSLEGENSKAMLSVDKNWSGLSLRDENGTRIWGAP